MVSGHDTNPLLADSAARTRDLSLVAAYVIPLLRHENVEVRRAVIRRLTSQWRTDAAQDAVAALLDSDLADEAADKLASLRDDRCLPRLVARVRAVRGLAAAQPFGVELLPEVLRVLAGPWAPRTRSGRWPRCASGSPRRDGRAEDPHDGNHGWRSDATACAWLGRIGPAAAEAAPVLRSMLAETGAPGEARPEAAEAYWRITGDAATALSVVDSLTTGDLGDRARTVAARVRA